MGRGRWGDGSARPLYSAVQQAARSDEFGGLEARKAGQPLIAWADRPQARRTAPQPASHCPSSASHAHCRRRRTLRRRPARKHALRARRPSSVGLAIPWKGNSTWRPVQECKSRAWRWHEHLAVAGIGGSQPARSWGAPDSRPGMYRSFGCSAPKQCRTIPAMRCVDPLVHRWRKCAALKHSRTR